MNFLFKIYYFDVFYHEDFRYVLEKNLNFKMCRNWRKTENVEWVGHMRRHSECVGHMRRHN